MRKVFSVASLALAVFVFGSTPFEAQGAAVGTNAEKVQVVVKAKQGGEWFAARKVKTDKNGVLELSDVLPGKYKFLIDEDDRRAGQTLGLEAYLRDEKGRKIKEKVDVKLYAIVGGNKILAGSLQTDKKGKLEVSGLSHDVEYLIDVSDTVKLSKKKDRPRVKVKTKIKNSDWFDSAYARLSKDGVLKMKNVLPGKYKFRYKSSDRVDPRKPFTLQMRLLHKDGKKIKRPTKVKLYVYKMGVRLKVAELKTDRKGNLTVPGVMTGVKYKIKVADRK